MSENEPVLTALALLEAYRTDDMAAADNITDNTDLIEVITGLALLANSFLLTSARLGNLTVEQVSDQIRRGLLTSAVPE